MKVDRERYGAADGRIPATVWHRRGDNFAPRRALAAMILAALGCSLMGSALAACGSSTAGATNGGSGAGGGSGHYKVGIAWGNLANPAAIGEYNQVVKAIKASGATIVATEQADNNATRQIAQVRTLIARGAQAIMLFSVDPHAIAPALGYAQSKGVSVVAQDNVVSSGHVYMDVGSDNVLMGNSECEQIGKQLHGQGEALIVLGGLATVPGQYRAQGVLNCLTHRFPKIKIIKTPSTNWDPATAAKYVDALLPANPGIKAIGLASDGVMLPAVSKTLKQLHKWIPTGNPGHIYLDTIDGTPLALQEIRAGYVDTTVEQPYGVYSQTTAHLLIDAVKGVKYHTGTHAGPSGFPVTTYSGNLWTQPPAPVVTKKNAGSRALWGNQSGT